MSFDIEKVEALYPGAGNLMVPAMLIWKLPAGKEDMMSEVCESGEYFAEEKIDGAWYQFTTGSGHEPQFNKPQSYLFGRTTSKVTGLMTEKGANVPHIMGTLNKLPPMTALIGEIYFNGCTAKDVVSIMGCLPEEAIKRQESPTGRGKIKYYVHDIISYDGVNLMNTGAWDRYRILKAIWEKHHLDGFEYLRLAEVVERGIEDEVSRILSSGGEGIVLKKRTAKYDPGHRPAWDSIKFKQMDDIDLVCTRVIPATREYTGKDPETWLCWERVYKDGEDAPGRVIYSNEGIPIDYARTLSEVTWAVNHYGEEGWEPVTKPYALGWMTAIGIGAYDDNGHLVELGTVASGLTDEDKANMTEKPDDYVGKVVSLHCMSIDRDEKTLRHPVFKSWRPDKNPQDCTITEVFK